MKRVYVDMVADLFHSGHVAFLKQARALGDYLIVGIVSDEDASSYKRRPILTLEERVAVVEACRFVDEVVPRAPLVPDMAYLKKLRIDILAHGDDFDQEKIQTYYRDAQQMGLLRLLPYTQGISTTDIIARVRDRDL